MKQLTFLGSLFLSGILLSTNIIYAQDNAPQEKKSEQIIITNNSDSNKKMTIEVDGDNVTVNGKPLSDYHDGEVKIIRKNSMDRDSRDFTFAPGEKDQNIELFENDSDNGAPKAFLGVLTAKADNGVKVNEVVKGSAAEKAGLAIGDIITKVGDKEINSPSDLIAAVTSHNPGDEVSVSYLRENKEHNTTVKLGEKKAERRTMTFKGDNPGMDGNMFNNGMTWMPKMQEMPEMPNSYFKFWNSNDNKPKLGLRIEDTENSSGVKVLEVKKGSAADKAGIRKDDIITSLNGEKVTNVDEVNEHLNESRDAEILNLKALRNNAGMNFNVKVPKKLKSANL
jgi:serine protease Do